MPSFDVVSEVDMHEVTNAIDQASRELRTRFDFRGVDASFELSDDNIVVSAQEEFQLTQLSDILREKLALRKVDVACLEDAGLEAVGKQKRQSYRLKRGIDRDDSKKIVKLIRDTKLKVQVAVQGEKVRVTGKKRDDLQHIMGNLRKAELGLPLQFTNFKD
ncbi:MAG: YajQ family cyclic di-GMP-binding protein [Gammaproteobacteria bacterium]|nr:YajQ family cyclic di-GMP-binding protein [Gammaproteobacteria bacterium]